MKRRPRDNDEKAIVNKRPFSEGEGAMGLILSGGGSRAAYQAGALRALIPYLKKDQNPIKVILGSSIGAINGLITAACLKDGIEEAVHQLELLWREREFRNTFIGSPSMAFFRAIKMATLQYMSPGPNPTSASIFDPTPLMNRIDQVLQDKGGLHPDDRASFLDVVGVMTTVEGETRKPLVFVSSHKEFDQDILTGASFDICRVDTLNAKHGFASAALPSVLPPVELDTAEGKVQLVDGGISNNVPVDPAVRFGAERVIIVDISGRHWWLDRFDEAHDTRPEWEVPADFETYCIRPPETFVIRNQAPLGPILKQAVSGSRRKFIASVGPVWPIYGLLKNKLGEDVAYETMSYVALDPDYLSALIEQGYNETMAMLRNKQEPNFARKSIKEISEELNN